MFLSRRIIKLFICFPGFVCLFCCVACTAVASSNLALGSHYTFSPDARYKLTRSSADATKLTDGKFALGYFWKSRSRTVGWSSSGVIRIDLDLASISAIDSIVVSTARGEHADVSYPKQIDCYVSADGIGYRYLGDLLRDKELRDGAYETRKLQAALTGVSGRYVSLFVSPGGKYTFIDEIEVHGEKLSEQQSALQSLFPLKDLNAHQKALAQDRYQQITANFLVSKLSGPAQDQLALAQQEGHTAPGYSIEDIYAANARALKEQTSDNFLVWELPPWEFFSPVDPPGASLLYGTQGLVVHAHQGGAAVSSIAVASLLTQPASVHFSMSPQGTSGQSFPSITLAEAAMVTASSGRVLADPLVPFGSDGLILTPGKSSQIWINIDCNAPPGEYRADLLIDSEELYRIPLSIKVWPAGLKDEDLPKSNAWAYPNWKLVREYPLIVLDDLSSHHINVGIVHPGYIPWANPQDKVADRIAKLTKFTKVVKRQQDSDFLLLYLGFNKPVHRSLGGKYSAIDDTWRDGFKTQVKGLVDLLHQQGISSEKIGIYPVDEPDSDEEFVALFEVAELLPFIDPDLKLYTTIDRVSRLSSGTFRALCDVIDVVQIVEDDLGSRRAEKLKEAGVELWSYSASGGKSAHPLLVYRLQAWRAFRYGATGIGFWAYADIGAEGTAWNDFDGRRPDYSVVYGYGEQLLSSKRWEAWRQGAEDYALLKAAFEKLKGQDEEAEFYELIDAVISSSSDYHFFLEVRRRLLEIASRD